MALIFHYFTEFVYDVIVKHTLVSKSTFEVYNHINTICPLIQHYLGKTNSAKRIDDWLHYIDYH